MEFDLAFIVSVFGDSAEFNLSRSKYLHLPNTFSHKVLRIDLTDSLVEGIKPPVPLFC
jgi:hypothetical protein